MKAQPYFFLILSCALMFALPGCEKNDGPAIPTTKDFVGSETCASCHAQESKEFLESGHPYKISKINGAPPKIPFLPAGVSPPVGYSWNDISYTIGGYGWKMRFIDKKGYVITQVEGSQFNLGDMTQSIYGHSVANGTEKYTCGGCHTTGWQSVADGALPQDGLEGMAGAWYAPGVQCEACHGKGNIHSITKKAADILKDASTEACSACHQRRKATGDTRQQVSGGWEMHRSQVEQLLTNKHSLNGMTCNSCHNPHASTKHDARASGKGIRKTCTDCHSGPEYGVNLHFNASCIDCHMPKTVKNAISVNKYLGDAPNHNFKINTSASASYINVDAGGSWANLDQQGSTLDFACYKCHKDAEGVGGAFSKKTMSELASRAVTFHK